MRANRTFDARLLSAGAAEDGTGTEAARSSCAAPRCGGVAVPACHGLRHASAAAAGRKERNNDERRPKHTLMIGRLPVIAIRRRP